MKRTIFDAGSTKTDVATFHNGEWHQIQIAGLNPNLMNQQELIHYLGKIQDSSVKEVFYYGAGLGSERSFTTMQEVLSDVFPAATIYIQNDVVGAAIAIGQGEPCFAGILGTGSNFCKYDGMNTSYHDRSVGYLAGDEGSGNAIGKILLRDFYYGIMPKEVMQKLDQSIWDRKLMVSNLYQSKMYNQALAKLVKHSTGIWDTEYFQEVVRSVFRNYMQFQVLSIGEKVNRMGCVGSIAYFFRDQLIEVGNEFGIELFNIQRRPIEGLMRFHT